MQREIKFRAWDRASHKMIDPAVEITEHGVRTYGEGKPHFVEVMQYTGLKTLEGTEIYEGDIVENPHGWRAEMKWHPMGWRLFKDGWFALSQKEARLLKIIGNIYENPDLLTL